MKSTKQALCAVVALAGLGRGAALGAPLTGSGPNFAIPSPNPGAPPLEPAALTPGSGSFTGTWSSPALPDWVGTFTADGPIPAGLGNPAGITRYDFTSLPTSVAPIGTYFALGDLDGGSLTGEQLILQAFDATGGLITSPWLDDPIGASGAGTGPGGAVAPGNMPGWDWNGSTGTYTFSGSTFGPNPSINVWLTNNTAITSLSVNRTSQFANFSISAPVPAPGAAALLGFASIGAVRRRRR